MKRLYVILDHRALKGRDPLTVARSVIRAGAGILQYRAKGLRDDHFFWACRRLARLCRKEKIPLVVNDRIDIAWSAGAAGVHLGSEDLPLDVARRLLGPKKIIGVSSHSVAEALRKARQGPTYVALGPLFRSRTKRTQRPLLGVSAFRQVARRTKRPIVAIGGINRKNAGAVVAAGASAVAVVESVLGSRQPGRAVQQLVQAIRSKT